MLIKKNQEVVAKIRRASLQGKSEAEKKPLYIEQNIFGMDMDTPIYRIFQSKYFQNDLISQTLTHVKASPLVWGDDFENPLLEVEYLEEETGESVSLVGLVDRFYALSWTVDIHETQEHWDDFSHENPAIRIKTTPRRLLDRLMRLEDNFFMLHHYIGLVEYKEEQEIIDWLQTTHYMDHLDSLGQGPALSLMALRTQFSHEKEVRLLYLYQPQADTSWVNSNVVAQGDICIVPFNWSGIIDEILLGPLVTESEELDIKNLLYQNGINCEVISSQFRNTIG